MKTFSFQCILQFTAAQDQWRILGIIEIFILDYFPNNAQYLHVSYHQLANHYWENKSYLKKLEEVFHKSPLSFQVVLKRGSVLFKSVDTPNVIFPKLHDPLKVFNCSVFKITAKRPNTALCHHTTHERTTHEMTSTAVQHDRPVCWSASYWPHRTNQTNCTVYAAHTEVVRKCSHPALVMLLCAMTVRVDKTGMVHRAIWKLRMQ